jgi:hypothetical protein
MRATTSFEEALESCLQELARTSDVESCLRRHPGHAEKLRPLLQTADMMRDHYRVVPQAPGGLAAGRERFLAVAAQERARAVSQTSDTGETVRMGGRRMRLSFARLFPIVLVALLGAAILGGGAVWAAQDSLPGELLYPVKSATEDVRLALASTPQRQVGLALDFVQERAQEIEALAAAGRAVPEETVSRMERHIERALTQTAGASDEEMEGLLAQVAERTRTQTQRLEQVLSQAPEQTRAEFRRAVAVCRAGAEAAEAGLQDPQTFRWRYRHREGEPEPTPEQEREREREREGEGTPVGTPSVTPQGPRGTTTPQATPKRLQGTAEATRTPQGPRGTTTPQATAKGTQAAPTAQGPRATGTPQGTMQGPRATAAPQVTPQGPQPTAVPQATPQGPRPTDMPQATPQGPQPTAMPQATSQEPEGTPGHQGGTPGGGQGGD